MQERNETRTIGAYANFLVVGHNAFEFVLDFGQLYAGSDVEHIHTRIVTTPAYANAMLETLRKAVERFEATYGCMPLTDEPPQ